MIRLDQPAQLIASLEDESRTISGIAVPWNVDAQVSSGQTVRFLPGSLPVDGEPPKFLAGHDMNRPLGRVVERNATPDGMMFTAKISKTQAGDEALVLAADGVLDAVSVGVDPLDYTFEGRTMVVSRGRWVELSLVPVGAFDGARVANVAAEAPTDPTNNNDELEVELAEETNNMENEQIVPEPVFAAAPVAVRVAAQPRTITAAEYLHALYHGNTDLITEITAANMGTTDTPGVLPEPIVRPIFDGLAADRPLMDALGVRAMPTAGKVFTIPKIVQRPTVGVTAENTTLSSQALQIDPVSLTKQIVGGYVQISEADADWSDPSAFEALIVQLARAYARETEALTATAVLDACSANETVSDWTDVDVVTAAIWAARTAIVENTGYVPTHLLASPDRVADLGTLSGTGGPIFPQLGPSNAQGAITTSAMGGTAFGLRLIESTALGNDHLIVCRPDGLAIFEQQRGTLTSAVVSQLATEVAFRGWYASATLDSQMFVGVGNV